MDYEYTNRHFNKTLKPHVTTFIKMLSDSMEKILRNNTLMDSVTKEHAVNKLNAMVFKIAYDEEISSKEKLQKYFIDLYVDLKSYFRSFMNVTKFTIEKTLRKLRKPTEIDYLEATSDNAAYAMLSNAIFLSGSVFSGILYSKNRPEYLNFGTLGFIIGHEMNHGFDVSGLKFDKKGLFGKWLTPASELEFETRAQCFKKQYSNFVNVKTGNKVDGTLTLSENLADNGGIVVAYKAYVKWLETVKTEQSLPHFQQFTPRQMFWISFAGAMCSKPAKNSVVSREKTAVYAEKPIRVNGVVMNSAGFANDFRCPLNSPMNPVKKCSLWR